MCKSVSNLYDLKWNTNLRIDAMSLIRDPAT